MLWNIENIVMIVIKHLDVNQISILNNTFDMPLNKQTKSLF